MVIAHFRDCVVSFDLMIPYLSNLLGGPFSDWV